MQEKHPRGSKNQRKKLRILRLRDAEREAKATTPITIHNSVAFFSHNMPTTNFLHTHTRCEYELTLRMQFNAI